MINDIKLGFKMLKYSMNYKQSMIIASLFIIIGFSMDVFATPYSTQSGVYYLFGMIFAVQLVHMLGASEMIQSSPYKKRLQTSVPALLALCIELIFVTIMIGIKVVHYFWVRNMQNNICNMLVMISVLIIIINIYQTIGMKFYWSSTILFFIAFMGVYAVFLKTFFAPVREKAALVSLPVGIVMCYGAIFVGSALMYLLGNLLYKKEYSKMLFRQMLKQVK